MGQFYAENRRTRGNIPSVFKGGILLSSRSLRIRPFLAVPIFLLLAAVLAARAEPRAFAPEGTPTRYMPTRQYDLQHLRLDLAFDWDAKSVSGTATNTLVPLLPGADSVVLDAAGLDVRTVRVNGAERPFTLDPQAQTLTVSLDRGYGPQDRLEVAVDYSAHPQTGLYFVGPDRAYPDKPRQIWSQGESDLNRFWFPSWDYPNDRTTTEVTATVKRPLVVVSNGKLLEVTDQPGGRRDLALAHGRPPFDLPALGGDRRLHQSDRHLAGRPGGVLRPPRHRRGHRPPLLRRHAEDPGVLLAGHGPPLPLRQVRPVGGDRLHVGRHGEHLRHHPDRAHPARRAGRAPTSPARGWSPTRRRTSGSATSSPARTGRTPGSTRGSRTTSRRSTRAAPTARTPSPRKC